MLRKSNAVVTRSFDDLADRLDSEADIHVRVERLDGSILEGRVVDVAQADLLLIDESTRTQTPVSASELRTVDVLRRRRVREWLIALGSIPAVTGAVVAIVVASQRLPWVLPTEGAALVAFGLVMALVSGLSYLPGMRKRIHSWLTHWQRLYSSTEGVQSP